MIGYASDRETDQVTRTNRLIMQTTEAKLTMGMTLGCIASGVALGWMAAMGLTGKSIQILPITALGLYAGAGALTIAGKRQEHQEHQEFNASNKINRDLIALNNRMFK